MAPQNDPKMYPKMDPKMGAQIRSCLHLNSKWCQNGDPKWDPKMGHTKLDDRIFYSKNWGWETKNTPEWIPKWVHKWPPKWGHFEITKKSSEF